MATPSEGLARLDAAADSGELDALCERYGIVVLTVFGSTARRATGKAAPAEGAPRDLDIAVITAPGTDFDVLGALADLIELSGVDGVDLAHLNRGDPLIRERALVGCVPLYEDRPGRYTAAMTAAIGQRMETDHMRRLDLKLLAR